MDLMLISQDLMPGGNPNMLGVVKYPMIRDLVATEGRRKMLAVLVLLIKDFCGAMNVVRNMNEEQMIEAGAMLLQECGNFRLEDYVMMFSLAKKGDLIKIYDRIDIQVITQVLDEYWRRRHKEGEEFQASPVMRLDSLGPALRRKDQLDGYELREQGMQDGIGRISAGLNELKNNLKAQNQKGGTA